MIYLSNARLENTINFDENPIILVIENKKEFCAFLQELKIQLDSETGGFTLYDEKNKENKLSAYCEMVVDYLGLSLNDRKIIGALYKKLQNDFAVSGDCSFLASVNENVSKLLENIIFDSDFDLTFDADINISDLFKLYGLKIVEDYENLFEKLINYIDVCIGLKKLKLLMFVNIKSYLTNEELQQLYKHCEYKKIKLLLLENRVPQQTMDEEEIIVIDEDLCQFRLENEP